MCAVTTSSMVQSVLQVNGSYGAAGEPIGQGGNSGNGGVGGTSHFGGAGAGGNWGGTTSAVGYGSGGGGSAYGDVHSGAGYDGVIILTYFRSSVVQPLAYGYYQMTGANGDLITFSPIGAQSGMTLQSNTNVLIQNAGVYSISGWIQGHTQSGGWMSAQIYKNGTAVTVGNQYYGGQYAHSTCPMEINLTCEVGDEISVVTMNMQPQFGELKIDMLSANNMSIPGIVSLTPYVYSAGTMSFGNNYLNVPAHGENLFYDRTAPIALPALSDVMITIEMRGQASPGFVGLALDPYDSTSQTFCSGSSEDYGQNGLTRTFFNNVGIVAADNTSQNPPWIMYGAYSSSATAYYWTSTVKFYMPANILADPNWVQGMYNAEVDGSYNTDSGYSGRIMGTAGWYRGGASTPFNTTGFRLLIGTTSGTTSVSNTTAKYRIIVSP